MMDKVQNRIFTGYQILIGIIFSLPILAPITAALGLKPIAQLLYFLYSFSCHQLHWRSLYIFDYQFAWCARDTFIWAGILVASFIVKKYKIRLNWYLAPIFVLPIALDGGIQTIATMFGFLDGQDFYTSTNFMRALTGAWFGLGVGLLLAGMMYEINFTDKLNPVWKLNLKFTGIGLAGLMILYTLIVSIWNFTSPSYPPKNILDLSVKTPLLLEERWIRQKDGACNPTKPKSIVAGSSITDVIFTPSDCFNGN